MKRTAVFILSFLLVFSTSIASFAQSLRPVRPPSISSDFVGYREIKAHTDGQGVLIRWQMTYETRNIGFYIYRMGDSVAELVNPTIVGGAATKTNAPTIKDGAYEVYDSRGTLGTVYYLQAVSAQGQRSVSSTFTPTYTDNFQKTTGHPKAYYEQLASNTNGEIASRGMKLPKALQNTVNESMLPPNPDVQRWVAAQPGAKIAVKADGMYRVTRTELENAGFNVNSNSANWKLFQEGNEQAIIVGSNDQYIEFYGRSIDAVESDTRMYYLIADTTPGRRIDTRVMHNLGGPVTSNSYMAAGVRKERTQYFANVLNGAAENYWGTLISDTPSTIPNPNDPRYVPFVLNDIDFSFPYAAVTLRLQGGGFVVNTHQVHATLNGQELGLINFGNIENVSATFYVPTSVLIEGPNFFELTATHGNDFSLFDTATINYARRYVSSDNHLAFFTPGYRKANVTGFSSPNVRVFDTTYDGHTQLMLNVPVVQEGSTFTVKLPSDRSAVMYAVEDGAMLQSPSVTFNTPSTLSTPGHAADIVMISHSSGEFIGAANSWATYRRSPDGGGFSVDVIDVADIYDEFNYGVSSASAITQFFNYAKNNWQSPGPKYAFMFGDGSYDPRNYQGFGNWNLIPTRMVDLVFFETGSDEALADTDNDGVANIPIGRIPARNAAQITTAQNKTMLFETPQLQDLGRGFACAADLPLGFDFEAMCLALRDRWPQTQPFTLVRRGLPPPNPQNLPDPQAHANLMLALNAGPYIVNYSGHGSAGVWAAASFFSTSDVPALANAGTPGIYTMLTCLNGYFIRPDADSIGEALLQAPNGGAVVTWSSTTDTTPDLQMLMGNRFYEQLSNGAMDRLGNLIADAKTVIPPGSDVGYSWILMGDPVLKVRQTP